jgi:dTDP-4-amino-4,6-dideoxygalactose transaminase
MNITDKYLFSGANDLENISNALLSKKLSGTSDIVLDYETCLEKFFGAKHAIATSSGTSAIQTALFTAGVRSGDEVIVSPACPVMTIFPIMHIGATPVFCDTCIDNFGLNIVDLGHKISHKTKAVIEVPMWGYPTEVIGLRNFLKERRIPLILDLAQAHGTTINNQFLSAYGDLACFSTHDRKILATGEGGFILTGNNSYESEARSFIQFGNMDGLSFGLNFKLGALQASIGTGRIGFIQNQLDQRKRNAHYVVDGIINKNVKEFNIIEGGSPNYYALLLKLSFSDNSRFIDFLSQKGIPSDILRYNYKVLYEYPILKALASKCENAELLSKSITTIPVHPGLNTRDLDYIISQINVFQ